MKIALPASDFRENQIRPRGCTILGLTKLLSSPHIPTIVRSEASAASGANLVKRTTRTVVLEAGTLWSGRLPCGSSTGGLSFRPPVPQPYLWSPVFRRNSLDKRSLAMATLERDTPWPTISVRDKFLKSRSDCEQGQGAYRGRFNRLHVVIEI